MPEMTNPELIEQEAQDWLSDFQDFRWRRLKLKLSRKAIALLTNREAMKRIKAIIDPRVSSKKQRDEGYSIENQTKSGVKWAKENGLCDGEYIVIVGESHESANELLEKRPYLSLILDLIDEVKPKYWRVSDFDRLTRNTTVWELNIKPVCRENQTHIIAGCQEHDLQDDTSEFSTNILAAVSQYANRQRVRRSREGKLAAAAKGRWLTWNAPFGYRKTTEGMRKGYLEPGDEDERKTYELMVQRVFEGMGINRIARELNLLGIPTKCSKLGKRLKPGRGVFKWKYGTLLHILRNPLYKGEYWFMGQKAQVPALISPEKWEALQAELDRRVGRRGLRASKRFYLLQSLLECLRCGRRLFGKVKESQRCSNSSCGMRLTALMKMGKYTGRCPKCGSTKVRQEQEQVYSCLSKKPDPDPRSCGLRSVNMKEAESVVWNLSREIAKSSTKLRELIKSRLEPQEVDSALSTFELESTDKEIAVRKEQIDALLRSRELLKHPEYVNQTLETLHKEIQELTASKRRLEAELGRRQLQRERIDWVERAWKKIGNRLDTMTEQEKFDFLHAFLVKVVVGYDEKAKMHTFEPVIAIDVGSPIPLPESLREQLSQV